MLGQRHIPQLDNFYNACLANITYVNNGRTLRDVICWNSIKETLYIYRPNFFN